MKNFSPAHFGLCVTAGILSPHTSSVARDCMELNGRELFTNANNYSSNTPAKIEFHEGKIKAVVIANERIIVDRSADGREIVLKGIERLDTKAKQPSVASQESDMRTTTAPVEQPNFSCPGTWTYFVDANILEPVRVHHNRAQDIVWWGDTLAPIMQNEINRLNDSQIPTPTPSQLFEKIERCNRLRAQCLSSASDTYNKAADSCAREAPKFTGSWGSIFAGISVASCIAGAQRVLDLQTTNCLGNHATCLSN